MKHSESITKVAVALVAAQAELPGIVKDRQNDHFKSKYATLDTIIEQIRPVLAAHHLAILQTASSDESAKVLTVATRLLHDSGEWIENAVVIPIAKMDPQGAGSALTYGRRYSLAALLAIAAEDDDDGNAASRPSSGKRQSGKDQANATSEPTRSAAPAAVRIDAATHMPIGKRKGKPYSEFTKDDLNAAAKWCDENGKTEYAKHIRRAAADLALGVTPKPSTKPAPTTPDEQVTKMLEDEDLATAGLFR